MTEYNEIDEADPHFVIRNPILAKKSNGEKPRTPRAAVTDFGAAAPTKQL
jgi:hypothetical protein